MYVFGLSRLWIKLMAKIVDLSVSESLIGVFSTGMFVILSLSVLH
jgi:hypothetical protein